MAAGRTGQPRASYSSDRPSPADSPADLGRREAAAAFGATRGLYLGGIGMAPLPPILATLDSTWLRHRVTSGFLDLLLGDRMSVPRGT